MRFQGKEFRGKGITIAIVDSGVNADDPRLADAHVDGWSITLGHTGQATLSRDFSDGSGHGTNIAAAAHHFAPEAKILAIRIMGKEEGSRTNAELMAAGIESAASHGAHVINLSLGTSKMGKAHMLRDCCENAVNAGSVVLAAAHPRGNRIYPADFPETLAVTSHKDCPPERFFFFDPKRFPRRTSPILTGKFLAHGYTLASEADKVRYKGSSIATPYMAGHVACLRQALPHLDAQEIINRMKQRALVPRLEIGYA